MGCGTSTSSSKIVPHVQNGGPPTENGFRENKHKTSNEIPKQNVLSEAEEENISNGFIDDGTGSKINIRERKDVIPKEQKREPNSNTTGTPAVAFEVKFEDNPKEFKRPHRLKKLDSVHTLTADMLAQKQAAAEENRHKELQKKVKNTSKRRKELVEAREMDKTQQQKIELKGKIDATEKNRAKAKSEIVAKQRRREERAKRVRAKAKQIMDGEDVVDFAVDPDETYNADEEEESWDMEKTTNSPNSVSSTNNSTEEPDTGDLSGNDDDNNNGGSKTVHDFFQ